MQLDQLEILSYVTIMHQPVTVISNTYSQMYVRIRHSLAHTQDLITILAGHRLYTYLLPANVGIKFCRCARECFICTYVHTFGYI